MIAAGSVIKIEGEAAPHRVLVARPIAGDRSALIVGDASGLRMVITDGRKSGLVGGPAEIVADALGLADAVIAGHGTYLSPTVEALWLAHALRAAVSLIQNQNVHGGADVD